MSQKIRIKLKSYDHNLVDKSCLGRTRKAAGHTFYDELTGTKYPPAVYNETTEGF